MNRYLIATLLAAACSAAWAKDPAEAGKDSSKASSAPAAKGEVHVMAMPAGIEWKPGPDVLPGGAQMARLEGDPFQAGYFALRLKAPAGYKIPAHFHPVQERITVIEGGFSLGHGDAFDEAKLTDYPAGSYISMPKGMRHFAMCKADCVIQLQTVGPWGITYVNPQDDPRRKKAGK